MPNTLANLLATYEVDHKIPNNDPILSIPLALFKEEEHGELITILWFYGHGRIDAKKAPKPNTEMGEHSAKKTYSLFESVKKSLILKKPVVISHDYRWVTPTLLYQFISPKLIYRLLNISLNHIVTNSLNSISNWFTNHPQDIIGLAVFSRYLQKFNTNSDRLLNIKKIARSLMEIEPIKSIANPPLFIYKSIILLNKEEDRPIKLHNKEGLTFMRDVLVELSRQYYPTLAALFVSLDLTIPQDLDDDLVMLLNKDLRHVPNEQLPKLAYYALLFVHKLALADPICNLSYAGKELPAALKKLDRHYTQLFKQYSEKPEQWGKVFKENFNPALKKHIDRIFPEVHPKLISLICFENCPELRKLFVSIWGDRAKEVKEKQVVGIIPMSNRFLLGKAYGNATIHRPIGNRDLLLLEQLVEKAQQYKLAKTTAMKGNTKKTKAHPQSSQTFFSHPSVSEGAYTADFIQIKMKIKDPALRASLYITAMDSFIPVYFTNPGAIIDFFYDKATDFESPKPISFECLQDFFEIHSDLSSIDPLIKEAGLDDKLEWMTEVQDFNLAITQIQQNISILNRKLKVLNLTLSSDKVELQIRWVEVQKYVQSSLLALAQKKLSQLEQEATQSSGIALS